MPQHGAESNPPWCRGNVVDFTGHGSVRIGEIADKGNMRASIPLSPNKAILLTMFLGLAASAASVPAQADPARNQVIGLTLTSGSVAPALVRQRVDYTKCAQSGCSLAGFLRLSSGWAGGVAVNSDVPPNLTKSLGGVWISNGKQIAQVDPETCKFKCQPQLAPLRSASDEVTGLAYWEDEAALLMSDSQNYLHWIDTSGCTLRAVACDTWRKSVIPKGYTIGGLATDDVRRFLFVSASTFGATPVRNKIWAGSLGSPKRPISATWCSLAAGCEMAVPTCGSTRLSAITGLGFDACTSTLYITDGRMVMAAKFVYDSHKKTCSLTALGCCDRGTGDRFGGICVLPQRVRSVGKSCVGAPCIDCPNMVAGTYGVAFLGNRNFALTLTNAPTGSNPAFLGIGVGACVTPGVPIGFCDTVKIGTGAPPLLIPMRVTPVGSGPCDGRAVFSFGVPKIAALCGVPMSAQWAMECIGSSGRGKAITNCVTFEITTN